MQKVVYMQAVIIALLLAGMTLSGFENAKIYAAVKDNLEVTNQINAQEVAEEEFTREISCEDLGVYHISHYCACEKCCGKSDGITASGTIATEGRTCAAEGLPIGTHLLIVATGEILTVEDRFGDPSKTERIDIFVSDHERAEQLGIYDSEIFIINY